MMQPFKFFVANKTVIRCFSSVYPLMIFQIIICGKLFITCITFETWCLMFASYMTSQISSGSGMVSTIWTEKSFAQIKNYSILWSKNYSPLLNFLVVPFLNTLLVFLHTPLLTVVQKIAIFFSHVKKLPLINLSSDVRKNIFKNLGKKL